MTTSDSSSEWIMGTSGSGARTPTTLPGSPDIAQTLTATLWTTSGATAAVDGKWIVSALVKLMYAAWGDHLPARLRDEELHRRLADAGVRRLQLNLDDEEVVPAMRISTGPEPIAAVVTVWSDTDEVTTVLAEATERLAGWEVDERVPIPPPETPSGERMDALANVAVLKKPDDLDREIWLHRWLVEHTPVAIETQASFGYVQNIVTRPLTDSPRPVDALVEELFPTAGMVDMHAFYGSGGDDAELDARLTRLMASVARIGFDRDIDLVPGSRYVYDLQATS
jgi:hypothetical protein